MIWTALKQRSKEVSNRRITSLFEGDTDRLASFTIEWDGLYFDYSKTNIDLSTRNLLIHLANSKNVGQYRESMFTGERINFTENRSVLHTLERNTEGPEVLIDSKAINKEVQQAQNRFLSFAEAIREGQVLTRKGTKFIDVINIGIGGSDLGPKMVTKALTPYADGPRIHFLSNIDGAQTFDLTKGLDPETTLVIVASKTFTTLETMTNALQVKNWLTDSLGAEAGKHMCAISNAREKCLEWDIPEERIYTFGEWVGGRYSIWSAIGLSAAIALGKDNFEQFHEGGKSMDCHFRTAPAHGNLPMMLALVGIWHNQICGYSTRAIIPYEERMEYFPDYLQQLEMESNGKVVKFDQSEIELPSGPVIWGGTGTNGQHAYFQHLHQSNIITPCEFLIGARGHEKSNLETHHDYLVANCLAQSEALMCGTLSEGKQNLPNYRNFNGNRPSTTLLYKILSPRVLGQLVALYEHRVFVEGVILGINSFDQWGVELGKGLAQKIYPSINDKNHQESGFSKSLVDLISKTHEFRENIN
ncbi:MAG: glucose-6-phosphate isomerase [Rhodobacteraceae bacterium]|nr:glucose-6-phosphate isomerase [Paracoccaceae bacterium]MXZ51343.1 glucose-6-phosphate isomerase [Paracoccaceae bacterium]MYF47017.1 glucose-6-phosphate isomerase [Paracoccaceae bacterium]MYI92625.1 glucose-6-phosphate isomerase [Paracoccaceae bacterium]MYJ87888.1 glucose-6-phosphate isomerase [Paracoccaceae bacterium]